MRLRGSSDLPLAGSGLAVFQGTMQTCQVIRLGLHGGKNYATTSHSLVFCSQQGGSNHTDEHNVFSQMQ